MKLEDLKLIPINNNRIPKKKHVIGKEMYYITHTPKGGDEAVSMGKVTNITPEGDLETPEGFIHNSAINIDYFMAN